MPHAWSAWSWSNTQQSCGNGMRNRSSDAAKPGGRSCEELLGVNFTTELQIKPCPGITSKDSDVKPVLSIKIENQYCIQQDYIYHIYHHDRHL